MTVTFAPWEPRHRNRKLRCQRSVALGALLRRCGSGMADISEQAMGGCVKKGN